MRVCENSQTFQCDMEVSYFKLLLFCSLFAAFEKKVIKICFFCIYGISLQIICTQTMEKYFFFLHHLSIFIAAVIHMQFGFTFCVYHTMYFTYVYWWVWWVHTYMKCKDRCPYSNMIILVFMYHYYMCL